MFRLEIVFNLGLVELSGILSGSKSYGEETISVAEKSDPDSLTDPVTTRYTEDNSWKDEINEFADAIQFDQEIITGSSLDALNTLRLVDRIYWADPTWRERFQLDCPN